MAIDNQFFQHTANRAGHFVRVIAAVLEDMGKIKSFINLYHTLSEMIHNSILPYEDDKLPIPDIIEGQFDRPDALALDKLQNIP
ncbi:hypothetical protein I4U23_021748 [Adineta vaga]|nr:hypothetical protein I4U23_021748 [Adineta vaga]